MTVFAGDAELVLHLGTEYLTRLARKPTAWLSELPFHAGFWDSSLPWYISVRDTPWSFEQLPLK